MKHLVQAALAAILSLGVFGCALDRPDTARWITLIDGASGLDNWRRVGDATWEALDGAIQATSGTGYLISKRSFRDFRMRAEFWASRDANSGIFLRVTKPDEIAPTSSYEVNIFDRRPDPSYGTGAIVGYAKVNPGIEAGGRWNTYDITAKGSRIVVILNGARTVDIEDSTFERGPLALQAAGGVIKWRRLEVLPL
jgi:hypothetical protein